MIIRLSQDTDGCVGPAPEYSLIVIVMVVRIVFVFWCCVLGFKSQCSGGYGCFSFFLFVTFHCDFDEFYKWCYCDKD